MEHINGQDRVYRLEFGDYLILINANNSSDGVEPIIDILRDKHETNGNGCVISWYDQRFGGSITEFYNILETL